MEKQWENVSQLTQLLILKRVYGPVAAITAYVGVFFGFVCLLRYQANHHEPPAAFHSEAAPSPA